MLSFDFDGVGVAVGAACGSGPNAPPWANAAEGTSRARNKTMTSVRRSIGARKVLRGRAGENPPAAQEP